MATIETRRLTLQPYRTSDWDDFRSLVQDGELMWRLNGPHSTDSAKRLLARLLEHEASSGLLAWAVTTGPEGDYCGHVFIDHYSPDERSAELGFVLHKAFHRRGIGTEMASAAYDYARLRLGCDVVSASVDDDNEPSKAVLARLGMVEVARESDDDGVYLVYSDRQVS